MEVQLGSNSPTVREEAMALSCRENAMVTETSRLTGMEARMALKLFVQGDASTKFSLTMADGTDATSSKRTSIFLFFKSRGAEAAAMAGVESVEGWGVWVKSSSI